MKTFKFLLVLSTHENNDVFVTLDKNIYDMHSKRVNILYITKTYLYIYYNFDPLKSLLYIEKLEITGVYIIFIISAQNIDCEYL